MFVERDTMNTNISHLLENTHTTTCIRKVYIASVWRRSKALQELPFLAARGSREIALWRQDCRLFRRAANTSTSSALVEVKMLYMITLTQQALYKAELLNSRYHRPHRSLVVSAPKIHVLCKNWKNITSKFCFFLISFICPITFKWYVSTFQIFKTI